MARRTHAEEIAFRQQVIRDRAAAMQERARQYQASWDATIRVTNDSHGRVAASLHADDTIYIQRYCRVCDVCGSENLAPWRIEGVTLYRCRDCGHEDV